MVDVVEAVVDPVVLSKSADKAIFPTKSAKGDTEPIEVDSEPIEVDSMVPSRTTGPVSPKKNQNWSKDILCQSFYPNEERIHRTPLSKKIQLNVWDSKEIFFV